MKTSDKGLEHFKKTSLSAVNTIDPLKSRFRQANQAPFINKEIQWGVIVRSKLWKQFLKSRSESDKKAWNKQRNKCVSLLRKTKIAYYWNLNVKDVLDKKKFWKTIKSFFSDKSINLENISLIENDNLLAKDFEIAEFFKKIFSKRSA